MNLINNAIFPMFVLIYAVLLAFAIIISPVLAIVLLLPLLVLAFWLAPVVYNYPKKTLIVMFYLWLAASLLWPSYLSLRLPGMPGIEPSRVFLSALILVWFFYVMKNPNIRQNLSSVYISNSKYILIFISIVVIKFISVFFSDAPFQSLFYTIKDLIEVFIPALIFISIFSFKKDFERFFLIFALIGAGAILIALMEIIVGKNIFSLYLPPGLVTSSEYIEQAVSEKIRGGSARVQGSFGHPLLLAQFLIVLLPVYIYLFFTQTQKVIRTVSFILIPITLFILYKTGSRSIVAGIAAEIIILAVLYLRLVMVTKKAPVLGWVIIISYPIFILLAIFMFYLTIDYFMGQTLTEVNSTNARFLMWEKGLSIISDSPVFGFGSGSAAYVLNFSKHYLTIDSYYLSVLLESGYVGLVAFITYLVLIFYLGMKLIKVTPCNSAALFTVMASMFGYLTVALILSTPHNLKIFFILSMLMLLFNHEAIKNKQSV